MPSLTSAFSWIVADAKEATRLVSVKLSAVATGVAGLALANQQFLLDTIDRVVGHAERNVIVGAVLFLVFLLPSLKSEFSPVPAPVAALKEPDNGGQ